jgi:hypothetical protein
VSRGSIYYVFVHHFYDETGTKSEKVMIIKRWLQSFASSFFSELQSHHMLAVQKFLHKDITIENPLDSVVATIGRFHVTRKMIREFRQEVQLSRTCLEVILELFRQRYTFSSSQKSFFLIMYSPSLLTT